MRKLTATLALAAAIVFALGCHKHEDHKHGGAGWVAPIALAPSAESRSIDVIGSLGAKVSDDKSR